MPELPEVETTCRGLEKVMLNQPIEAVTVRERRMRVPVPEDLEQQVEGAVVQRIWRRAKYAFLELDNGKTLMIHLGMSGRMGAHSSDAPLAKHDHVIFHLPAGVEVRFHDPRRFGQVIVLDTEDVNSQPFIQKLGPEPLSDAFTGDYLYQKFKGKQKAIKVALMDQENVVGVGNIYANEALFQVGVKPTRPAGNITKKEAQELVAAIQEILQKAIDAGGSTLQDYRGADGQIGYYFWGFKVYGKTDEPCLVCGTDIQKIVLGQRGTWFCKTCQPR